MKKICSCFLAGMLIFSLFSFSVTAIKEKEYHWYTTKTKNGRQALAAEELLFVEELGGYYIDHRHGDTTEEKVVYLTFDAGYENGNTEKILNTLRDTKTPAAFFLLKHFVTECPSLVVRMQAEGHLVCNHTARHTNLSMVDDTVIEKEIRDLEDAVMSATGKSVASYFRPPEGSFSRTLLQKVDSMGYRTVFWSLAYADWDNNKQPSEEKALSLLLERMHNGAVILLHPTSATNAAILPKLIQALKEKGYRFGTLDELCIER